MLEYIIGDLLKVTTGMIVHGCNNLGIMDGGIAKAIKKKYPKCFDEYYSHYVGCNEARDVIDHIQTTDTLNNSYELYSEAKDVLVQQPELGDVIYWHNDNNLIIANGITQEAFDLPINTNYDAVKNVFENVFNMARALELEEIHIPMIGSGIGGGCWNTIKNIIIDRAENHKIRFAKAEPIRTIVHCLSIKDIPNRKTS